MKILPNHQNFQQSDALKPYKKVAEGMETTFTAHMLEQMNKTVNKEKPDSSALGYYKSLLDMERAKLMSQSDSGIGVKELVLDEIVPQHLKQKAQAGHNKHQIGNYQRVSKENGNEQ